MANALLTGAHRRSAAAPQGRPGAEARPAMVLVANPAASRYTPEVESAVLDELSRGFSVEVSHTAGPGHGIDLARGLVRERGGELAAVAVLGGDGAVNEVANGLAGSATPLVPLPFGRTSVLARTLGLPRDARQAARWLCDRAARLPTRRVDLGTMNGRHFTFASGVGLSASANRRLSARGETGRRLGGHLFLYEALAVAAGYLRRPPRLEVEIDGSVSRGVTLVAQNADPLTYLGGRPLPLGEEAGLATGTLSLVLLRDASARVAAALVPRIALGGGAAVLRRPEIESLPEVTEARVRSLDGRALPVEVDGEFVGEYDEVVYAVAPGALTVVAAAPGDRAIE